MQSNFAVACGIAALLSLHGLRKGSLSPSGALSAFLVGSVLCRTLQHGLVLFLVYGSCSLLTRWQAGRKSLVEENFVLGGFRNWEQVLANSLPAVFIALLPPAFAHSALGWRCFLSFFAAAAGDTWSSEVGVLSRRDPIHILTFRKVPRGTNGGVSALGLAAAIGGGAFLGAAMEPLVPGSLLIGLLGGILGSMIDSVLGALFQSSYWCPLQKRVTGRHRTIVGVPISGLDVLSNHHVNVLSCTITAFSVPWLLQRAASHASL